jgi:uncharacterized protein (DUF1800 family)
MALRDRQIQHLLRRAGFGATREEIEQYAQMGVAATIERLLNYEQAPDDGLAALGHPGYPRLPTTFTPNTSISHARIRWLLRMAYTSRPLQEKMALMLHGLFATSYVKISGLYGSTVGTRMMAAFPNEDAGGMRGQIEMLRDNALGNFRDIMLAIARDPAMLVWLDGETNKKGRPQENFSREVMELFSIGRLAHTEPDVYEGARVFTGWNLRRIGAADDPARRYEFFYDANEHDTGAKTFSFPIYTNGSTVIPARSAADGYQDGVDFIDALARHPQTGLRLANRMWYFFVSEQSPPTAAFMQRVSSAYYSSGYNLRVMMLKVLTSPEFWNPDNEHAIYSSPVDYAVRALKEIGGANFAMSPVPGNLDEMGQSLYAPPSVGGWPTGSGWFSTGALIARMNYAASLTRAQRTPLRDLARPYADTPQKLLAFWLDRLPAATFDGPPLKELVKYLGAGVSWSRSDTELMNKVSGLVHLIVGSPEYQLI